MLTPSAVDQRPLLVGMQPANDDLPAATESAEMLRPLLTEAVQVRQELDNSAKQGHSDAQKLAAMVELVRAERKGLQADAAAAKAAESASQTAREELDIASNRASSLLKDLQQQQSAQAEAQSRRLQQQQVETETAKAQAAALVQQLQEGATLSQQAAAAAKDAHHTFVTQKRELTLLSERLTDVNQQAKLASSNLQVDVGSAQEGLASQINSLRGARQQAAAECSRLQVIV